MSISERNDLAFTPNEATSSQKTSTSTASTTENRQTVFHARYQNDLLVALHGSRTGNVSVGSKIEDYRFDDQGNFLSRSTFMDGWLQNNISLGRPTDILIGATGTIYISDDKAGVIYSVRYQGE